MAVAGTLEQRVSALEQEIAGLQGSEALQPNYLTVTPGGQVGANFTGVITADGLTIPAGAASGTAANEIQWVRQSDGAVMAILNGYRLPGGPSTLQIRGQNPDGGAEAGLVSIFGGSNGFSELDVQGGVASGAGNNFIAASVGAHSARIIDDLGDSSFLQLAGGAAVGAIAFGTSVAVCTASQSSAVVTVPHGLGRTPKAIATFANGIFAVIVENGGQPADATNLYLIAWLLTGAATTNVPFYWIAIG